jgi:hypothetical protein
MKSVSNITGPIAVESKNLASVVSPSSGYIGLDSTDNKLKFYNSLTTVWENYNDLLTDAINALKDSVPVDGDTLNKLNTKILNNISSISALSILKVNFSDIVDNLTSTDGTTKVLSANQGRVLKEYVDSLRLKRVTTALLTNNSNATLSNINELNFVLQANKTYSFEYKILFQSNASANTGIALTLSCPAGLISASVDIPVGNDGAAGAIQGQVTSSGDLVIGTGVQAINTTYVAIISGVVKPTVSGNFFPQFRSEINGSQVSCRIGSIGILELMD